MNILKIIFIYLFTIINISVSFSQNILIGGAPFISNNNEMNEAAFCESEIIFSIPNTIFTGLASDGEHFWTCANFTEKIYIHDIAGNQLGSFDVPFPNLSGMTIFQDTLWVVDEQSGLIVKLDKNNGEIFSTYEAPLVSSDPADPNIYGLTNDGNYIWLADYGGNVPSSIIKLNPDNASPIDTLPVDLELLLSIFFIDDSLYGIDLGSESLYQIDTETGDITFIDFWCTNNPYDIVPLPCVGLYCSGSNSGTGPVYRIDHSGLPLYLCKNIEAEICEGEIYNGNIYIESTTFSDTIELIGFDSIYTTHIEVNPIYDTTLFSSQCEDPKTEPGTYIFINNFSTYLGCDSLVTNILEVYPNKNTTFNIALMPGEDYNGTTYFSDTSIVNIYETQFGCDSIVTVNIIMEISGTAEGQFISPNIFPNPSSSTIYINSLPIYKTRIIIYSPIGEVIYDRWHSEREAEIDVRNWQNGIYYMAMKNEMGIAMSSPTKLFVLKPN